MPQPMYLSISTMGPEQDWNRWQEAVLAVGVDLAGAGASLVYLLTCVKGLHFVNRTSPKGQGLLCDDCSVPAVIMGPRAQCTA